MRFPATAQPRFETYSEKKDEFFRTAVDAQISFVRDDTGKVTHLVLDQNGIDQNTPNQGP